MSSSISRTNPISPPQPPALPTTITVEGRLYSVALRTFIIIAASIVASGGALAFTYSIGLTLIPTLILIGVGSFLVGGVAAWGLLDELSPRSKTITVPQTPKPSDSSSSSSLSSKTPKSSSAATSSRKSSSRPHSLTTSNLQSIKHLLDRISQLGRDSKNLDQMLKLLNGTKIKNFESSHTKEGETPDPKTPVGQALYRIRDLRYLHDQLTQIKAEIHHFRSWTIDDKGIIPVPGDGNCAFNAFIVSYKLIAPDCELTPADLRAQTVRWIRTNIATNPRMPMLVLHAMLAFYYAEKEHLEEEIGSLEAMRANPQLYNSTKEDISTNINGRIFTIQNNQTKIDIILEQLFLPDELLVIDTEGDIFKDYIASISRSGVFASSAELCALAEMMKVRLEVYNNDLERTNVFNETAPEVRTVRIKQNEFEDHFDAYLKDTRKGETVVASRGSDVRR